MATPVYVLLPRGSTDPNAAIAKEFYPSRAAAITAQESLTYNHPDTANLGELVPHPVFLSLTAPEEVPGPPEVESAAEVPGETTAL